MQHTSNIDEAKQLLDLSTNIRGVVQRIVDREEARPKLPKAARVTFVTSLLRARARRTAIFTSIAFREPGWDMLLELYIAEAEQRTVGTSSLCYSSGAPHTTALRWINALTAAGYVVRRPDRDDRRGMLARLSADGKAAIDSWIDEAAAVGLV